MLVSYYQAEACSTFGILHATKLLPLVGRGGWSPPCTCKNISLNCWTSCPVSWFYTFSFKIAWLTEVDMSLSRSEGSHAILQEFAKATPSSSFTSSKSLNLQCVNGCSASLGCTVSTFRRRWKWWPGIFPWLEWDVANILKPFVFRKQGSPFVMSRWALIQTARKHLTAEWRSCPMGEILMSSHKAK